MFTIVNATVDAVGDQFAWRESPSNGPVKRSNGAKTARRSTRSTGRRPDR